MASFFRRKSKRNSTPLIRGEGIAYFLRTLALMSIIVGCVVAYWYNFENRFEEIRERAVFATLSSLMTYEQKKGIMLLARSFEKKWGVDVLLEVHPEEIFAPPLDSSMLFIGFVPKRGHALLLMPPLLKKAISPKSIRFITTELDFCAIDTAPDVCLSRVLIELDTLLRD